MTMIHISTNNTKLGKIANISMLPGITCVPGIPCWQCGGCYAIKACRRPAVLNAWRDNTINWFENPAQFEWDLLTFLSTYTKKHFRWFVGGDIPNQDFVDMMIRVGKIFPHIQFLAFTKRYKFDYRFIPSNLNIVFSAWPGLKMVNRYNRPVAWMQDGTESRIPSTAIKCSGTCENCGICWNLPCGYSVWFEKH